MVLYDSPVKVLPTRPVGGGRTPACSPHMGMVRSDWCSAEQYLHLMQLLHTFQLLQDPDYECVSPGVFSILPGHLGF